MIKAFVFGMGLALGISTVASAAMLPSLVGGGDTGIVKVAQGCGPGWHRGPYGRCHPMGYVHPYYHPYHHHCWWRAGVRYCR
jgi:hypothetical protein